jgi:hypothetical protein
MSLLTPTEQINAALADDAKNCALHLASAAVTANRMVTTIMRLDDAALTSWLNSRPPEATMAIFAAHGELGTALNHAITTAAEVLTGSGIPAPTESVDIRSVAEKLATANRTLAFEDGIWSVETLPPPPAPEPIEEPTDSDDE